MGEKQLIEIINKIIGQNKTDSCRELIDTLYWGNHDEWCKNAVDEESYQKEILVKDKLRTLLKQSLDAEEAEELLFELDEVETDEASMIGKTALTYGIKIGYLIYEIIHQ